MVFERKEKYTLCQMQSFTYLDITKKNNLKIG